MNIVTGFINAQPNLLTPLSSALMLSERIVSIAKLLLNESRAKGCQVSAMWMHDVEYRIGHLSLGHLGLYQFKGGNSFNGSILAVKYGKKSEQILRIFEQDKLALMMQIGWFAHKFSVPWQW